MARKGFRVLASGRTESQLNELAEESGGGIVSVPMDVTDEASTAKAREEVDRLTNGEGLYGLVNNAGYGQGGPLELITDAEIRAQYETNV